MCSTAAAAEAFMLTTMTSAQQTGAFTFICHDTGVPSVEQYRNIAKGDL